MKNIKWIFKIVAAICIVSAAVCTLFIFKQELTELVAGAKQKLCDKKCVNVDFADFDDV